MSTTTNNKGDFSDGNLTLTADGLQNNSTQATFRQVFGQVVL